MTDCHSYASLVVERLRRIAGEMERFIGPPEMAPGPDPDDLTEAASALEAERARADEAEKGKDYAIRWANRSVDSVKTECFKEIDATRKVLETWDTPTDMPKARVERLRQVEDALRIATGDKLQLLDALDEKQQIIDCNQNLAGELLAAEAARDEAVKERDALRAAVEQITWKALENNARAESSEARAQALAKQNALLRETLSSAPRPSPPDFDPVPYMDWYFKVRGAALETQAVEDRT